MEGDEGDVGEGWSGGDEDGEGFRERKDCSMKTRVKERGHHEVDGKRSCSSRGL